MKIKKIVLLLFITIAFNQTFSQQTETADEIREVDASEDEDYENIPFAIIEEVPVFPGCEGTNQEKKHCFNLRVRKHVMRRFNASLADSLNLPAGKQRILTQFKISKTGEIQNIVARGPHKILEEEAVRIIKLLPKMSPGKQRGKPINVMFSLPITFTVVGASKDGN